MVLDTSIDARQLSDSVEKNREHRILCVPDYSDDIYKHIREMEVSLQIYQHFSYLYIIDR